MSIVSVCIPTYNRVRYLKKTLESVYAQTFRDFEVVIVDDGSTDGTSEMLEKGGYQNLQYFRQENSGDAAARNKLIELAKGEYISFLDSDDLLIEDSLERLVSKCDQHGGDCIIYGSYYRIDEKGNVSGKCKRKLYSGKITEELFQNIFVYSCGALIPIQSLKDEGGFDTSLRFCSDYLLWLKLSTKYNFFSCQEPTFKRRRHAANLSAISIENRITELKVLEKFYYELGGRDYVPELKANKKLSAESYRVAKTALSEGDKTIAMAYFDLSLKYKFNLKSLFNRFLLGY